jgi:periplasmic protein TonB
MQEAKSTESPIPEIDLDHLSWDGPVSPYIFWERDSKAGLWPDRPEHDEDEAFAQLEDLESEAEYETCSSSPAAQGNLDQTLLSPTYRKYLKYALLVSILLHAGIAASMVRYGYFDSPRDALKPGEKVTQVRLVDFPDPPKQEEPPPAEASAISDRNHTAKIVRMPKIPVTPSPEPPPPPPTEPDRPEPPEPAAPVGKVEPQEQRLAALQPPLAPEELVKQEPDPVKEEKAEKKVQAKKPAEKKKPSKPEQPAARQARAVVPKSHKDLLPNSSEIERVVTGQVGPRDFFDQGTPDEPIVDINTRDDKFFSYLLHLKRKIQEVWVYPRVAAQSGVAGQLTLEFLIARDGQLVGVNLLDSSGHSILDESAIAAIRSAAPYHKFPDRMKAKRLRIRANFIYITQRSFGRIM